MTRIRRLPSGVPALYIVEQAFTVRAHLEAGDAGAATWRVNRPAVPISCDPARGWTAALEALRPTRPAFVYGNPPCAPFSTAGRRAGRPHRLDDGRVLWARDVVQVAAALGARVVAVESVRGAQRWAAQVHDRIWAEFRSVYPGQMWVGVNARQHGLPQDRPRVFWVLAPEVFTLAPPPPRPCPTILDWLAGVPRAGEPAVPENASYVYTLPPGEQVAILEDLPPGTRLGRMDPDWIRARSPKLAEAMAGRDLIGYLPKRLRNDACAPVVMGWAARHVHPIEPRYLTQRELSRLCGFPDDWRWTPERPGLAQEELGRNVCPPVAAWLAGEIAAYLRGDRAKYGSGTTVVDTTDPSGQLNLTF